MYRGLEEVSIPDNVYARHALIHRYVNEGLETAEFGEARSNMTDLIQGYEMYETAGAEEVGEGEEDDEEAASTASLFTLSVSFWHFWRRTEKTFKNAAKTCVVQLAP